MINFWKFYALEGHSPYDLSQEKTPCSPPWWISGGILPGWIRPGFHDSRFEHSCFSDGRGKKKHHVISSCTLRICFYAMFCWFYESSWRILPHVSMILHSLHVACHRFEIELRWSPSQQKTITFETPQFKTFVVDKIPVFMLHTHGRYETLRRHGIN